MSNKHSGFSKPILAVIVLLGIGLLTSAIMIWWPPSPWSDAEKALIASLWIGNLPPVPDNPANNVATNADAAELGHALFFDPRLSSNAQFSCASCHQPEKRFTDGLAKARALGQSRRNTPSIVGLAYSPWLYWDGRRDSLWSQALSPLEDPQEQGSNRMAVARLVTEDADYAVLYETVYGGLPDFSNQDRFPENAGPALVPGFKSEWARAWEDMREEDRDLVNRTFANVGKAIAAYERLLLPSASRFDEYARSIVQNNEAPGDIFNNNEEKGLRLFIGKGRCMECHNGPLFTNNEFHNTGILSAPGDLPDRGRIDGVREVKQHQFNCLGPYSDAAPNQCLELIHAREGVELIGAFKTPSLRNLQGTAPYMHKGQIVGLAETLDHYNTAPFAMIGHNEAENPLGLLPYEVNQLEAFLNTLSAPIAVDQRWLQAP